MAPPAPESVALASIVDPEYAFKVVGEVVFPANGPCPIVIEPPPARPLARTFAEENTRTSRALAVIVPPVSPEPRPLASSVPFTNA